MLAGPLGRLLGMPINHIEARCQLCAALSEQKHFDADAVAGQHQQQHVSWLIGQHLLSLATSHKSTSIRQCIDQGKRNQSTHHLLKSV